MGRRTTFDSAVVGSKPADNLTKLPLRCIIQFDERGFHEFQP